MLCVKLKQTSCSNVKLRKRKVPYPSHSLRNLLQPCQLSANKKGDVAFKLFKKGDPYHQGVRNKEVPQFNRW